MTTITSTVLKLQSLQLEYTNVLTQYKQAYATYLNNMNAPQSTFTTVNDMVYLPDSGSMSMLPGSGVSECEESCRANSQCIGATYVTAPSYSECLITTGSTGTLFPHESSVAIVPPSVKDAHTVQALNQQLIDLNGQISNLIEVTQPIEQAELNAKNNQKGQLNNVYQILLNERRKIDKLQKEYKDITQRYDDNSIYVTQTSAIFLIWFLILIIIIVFTVKLVFFPEFKMLKFKVLFWIFIICLLTILTVYMQLPSVFGMWFALIMMIILMKLKMIPQP